jgi:copper chaperone NosL
MTVSMSRNSRLLIVVAALLLAAAYVLPLWRIELLAPQYPEGLGLRIWINRITGAMPNDLNSINNLNHYIGMHRIVPDAIPELRFMPWFVGSMIGCGLLTALVGRRWLLAGWAAVLSSGAAIGLADFWKWGYDYGHHLDPEAAIKIPGMTYQPPLIGTKQLLNFHAASWPDVAGWLAIVAVGIVATVAARELRRAPARKPVSYSAAVEQARSLVA